MPRNKLVIPGFVNTHYHSHDLLVRGLLEELPLEIWGLYSRPQNYPPRSLDEVRIRTLLGAVECLKYGITTVQDMHTLYPAEDAYLDAILDAYDEIGIRVVFSLQVSDLAMADTIPYWREVVPADLLATIAGPAADARAILEAVEAPLKRIRNTRARVHWALGPSGPQRCSQTMLEGVGELAERYDLPIFTHLYETKSQVVQARQNYPDHDGSLVRFLKDLGLLGPRLTMAHAIWLERDEMDLMAEADTGAVLNPVGNQKLKSGVPAVLELMDAGVRLALGCDNCSCSDVQSLLQAMKAMCLVAAVSDPEPKPESGMAEAAIRVATRGGARAVGLDGVVGAIRPGLRADLVLVNLDDPAFLPFNSAARQLVYGEAGRGVETVIVDGRVVMQDRRIQTIDEEDLYARVRELTARIQREFEGVKARNAPVLDYLFEAHRRAWAEDVGMHRYVGPPRQPKPR